MITAVARALGRTSVIRPTPSSRADCRTLISLGTTTSGATSVINTGPRDLKLSLSRLFSTRMGAPVILCGATERIGSGVIENLKPEYDVIHFVKSVEAAKVQIKAIFEGDQAPPSDSDLGSKDYSQKPIAVILGGAFTDENASDMMKDTAHIHPVPWLRADTSKPTPPLGPQYGKAMVARLKERIPQLEREGKMGEAEQFWY